MKYAITILALACAGAWGQTLAIEPTRAAGEQPPLKCGQYEHEQYTPAYCASNFDPNAMSTANCLFVPAGDRCVEDMHEVTEKEWQELLTWIETAHNLMDSTAALVKSQQKEIDLLKKKEPSK